MRKYLKQHLCDTETSKEIGRCDNGYSPNDFKYIENKLYKTKAGFYFLSTYHVVWRGDVGKMTEELTFFEYEDAKSWAESNLSSQDYEKAFGLPEGVTVFSVRLTPQARKNLEEMRKEKGMTFNEIINELLISARD